MNITINDMIQVLLGVPEEVKSFEITDICECSEGESNTEGYQLELYDKGKDRYSYLEIPVKRENVLYDSYGKRKLSTLASRIISLGCAKLGTEDKNEPSSPDSILDDTPYYLSGLFCFFNNGLLQTRLGDIIDTSDKSLYIFTECGIEVTNPNNGEGLMFIHSEQAGHLYGIAKSVNSKSGYIIGYTNEEVAECAQCLYNMYKPVTVNVDKAPDMHNM